jgi:hypothetical protein
MKDMNLIIKIDDVHDFTRVLGLPGCWNYKWDKRVHCSINKLNIINEKFILKSMREKKIKNNNKGFKYVNKLTNIEDSLEWQVISKYPPEGHLQRHK